MNDLESVRDLGEKLCEFVDCFQLEFQTKTLAFEHILRKIIDYSRFSSSRTRSVTPSSPAALNVCNFSPATIVGWGGLNHFKPVNFGA